MDKTCRSAGQTLHVARDRLTRIIAAAWFAFGSASARADPGRPDKAEAASSSTEHCPNEDDAECAHDDAPLPDEARNVVHDPPRRARHLLWIPRIITFVPRWVVWGVMQPPRLTLVALERHRVRERFVDLFFNESRTFGVLPILRLERFQGTFIGARLVRYNLFGVGGNLSLRTGVGDRLRQDHRLSIGSGTLFGPRTAVRTWIEYRLRPRETFAGIGNVDVMRLDDPRLLDARLHALETHDMGIISRFREDRFEWGMSIERALSDTLAVQLGHETMRKTFDDAILMQEPYLTTVYDPATLPGFATGFLQSYVELAFVYTTLSTSNRYVPAATPSRGWRIRGYHGLAHVLVPGGRYQRSGIDVARFFDLYRGDRVLRLRLRADLAQGSYQQIPFSELPRLGGAELLRGFRQDLFRDRVAALLSAEYYFPVGRNLAAYFFADLGRVWGGIHELSFHGLRLGYGAGLQLHEGAIFLSRLQIATSPGGEFFFALRFEPTFSLREYI